MDVEQNHSGLLVARDRERLPIDGGDDAVADFLDGLVEESGDLIVVVNNQYKRLHQPLQRSQP